MTSEKLLFHFLMLFERGDKNEKLGNGLNLSLFLWIIFLHIRFKFMCEWNFYINSLKKTNFMATLYGWGSTVSRLQSHFEETVYFLTLGRQEFLVFIWLTSEPPSDFKHRSPELGIQHLNRQAVSKQSILKKLKYSNFIWNPCT